MLLKKLSQVAAILSSRPGSSGNITPMLGHKTSKVILLKQRNSFSLYGSVDRQFAGSAKNGSKRPFKPKLQFQVRKFNEIMLTEVNGTNDGVLELTYVAGPVAGHQSREGVWGELRRGLVKGRMLLKEMSRQPGHIPSTIARRRKMNGEQPKPVSQLGYQLLPSAGLTANEN